LQAVYNKSDAVLAYPKGRYHEKFDAPAPREVPPANNAPRPANAGAGQTTADVPSPAAQVESASHGHASVQPDEIKPQDGSVEIKTNGQSAAPSTDEIVQPREKAAGASRDSIDAELDKVLHNLDSLAGTQQTEVGAQTPNTGQKGIVSSNLRVPKLQLPKHVQQNGTPLSTPGRTPRPRLTSNVEPKPKIQSARPPAPEKLPESKDVKVEGNGPPDNPVTAAMPVTLSAVPPVEASATVSPPSQPQVLSETQTEPLSEATPGPRPAGDQWTREQQDAANRKLSRTYMNNLMRLMNSDRLNLRSVFETLDKLANSDLEDYRADSLTLVDLPNSKTLEYFNNVMHSIQLDLDSGSNNFIPKMSAAKLQRVTAIVKEWQELRLTTRAPLRLSEGNVFELKAALENSNLGRQPVRPTKGNG
jgi:hypothetical protein